MKLVDGKLSIDVQEVCENLSTEDRVAFIRYVAADETLFAAVLECVVDPSRWGYFFDSEWHFGFRLTGELREKLIPLMSGVARELVAEALRQRNAARVEENRHHEWAWKLYHAWPLDHWRDRPELPDWVRPEEPSESELPPKEAQ